MIASPRSMLLVALALATAVHAIEHNPDFEVLRGAAWTFHTGGDPCGVDRTNCTFAALSTLSPMTRLTQLSARELAAKPAVSIARANDNDAIVEPMPPVRTSPRAELRVSSERIYHLAPLAVSFALYNDIPRAGDWLGVYCNDNEQQPLPDTEYVDWRYTGGVDAATLQFGPLINMRCTWQFRYFAVTTTTAPDGTQSTRTVKLGTSPFVRMARGATEPLHVHLASTTSRTEMRVHWVSASVDAPVVRYGRTAATLVQSAAGVGDTYSARDMCHAPATIVASQRFRDPGTLFTAVMRDLEPQRRYYYQVGDASSRVLSPVFTFQMPPLPGTVPMKNKPHSFFVYGDLGDWNIQATGSKPAERTATTIDLMRRDLNDSTYTYAAAMHNGDVSYAMGRTYLWDQFGALVEPVASRIPYMVGVGNHEYCYTSGGTGHDPSGAGATNGFHPIQGNYGADSRGECGVPLAKRFMMPSNGNNVFWWSVEFGLSHHTQISSEHDFTVGSRMYEWLRADLASVDRTQTPWLFVYLHRPLYASEMYDSDYRMSLFLRQHLEPLLATYRVDAVFSGHYHAYELTCPVFNGTCRVGEKTTSGIAKALAPVHIMVGSAGADIDNVGYFDVPWRVAAELNYGYGRVHVYNASHAKWEFVRNKHRAVTSSTWIVSDHNWTLPGVV